jgi:hypothetical protein
MMFRAHAGFFTAGGSWRLGATNDQNPRSFSVITSSVIPCVASTAFFTSIQCAPVSIHR